MSIFFLFLVLTINGFTQKNPSLLTISDTIFEVGDRIRAPRINLSFSTGFEEITDSIKEVALFINQHPNFIFELSAHTDHRGNAENNLDLTEKRVIEIKSRLIPLLYNPSQIRFYQGKGENEPIIPLDEIEAVSDMEKRERMLLVNRRTELRILEQIDIAFVNFETIKARLPSYQKELERIQFYEGKSIDSLTFLDSCLQVLLVQYANTPTCFNDKTLEDILIYLQETMINMEKEYLEKISKMTADLETKTKDIIDRMLKNFSSKMGFKEIMDIQKVLYCAPENDVTNSFLAALIN